MASQGVRGLRLNLYSPLREKAPLAARFSAIAGHAHELNWHIEVIAPIKMLSENATLLAELARAGGDRSLWALCGHQTGPA